MGIVCDMAGVFSIFNKIRPPRAELWVHYLAIFRFELKVGVNGNELGIDPPYECMSQKVRVRNKNLSLVATADTVPIIWEVSSWVRAGGTFDRERTRCRRR